MANRTGRAPLAPRHVIDAALQLTRERGLEQWTIRDLAQALGTWPNTINHHVGNREAVVLAVLDQIVAEMPIPPETLPWQHWFRTFLTHGRRILSRYRGAAWRLCRDGPAIPSALPIIDRGTSLLLRAGFGADAPPAYGLLLTNALMLVALSDDRARAGYAPEHVAARLHDMPDPTPTGDGWAAMRAYMASYLADAQAATDRYYAFTIDRTIAGLEQHLAQLQAANRSQLRRPTRRS